MTAQNVFENKTVLAGFLHERFENPTLLKVQKALYLLWAFYAGTYGSIDYTKSDSDELAESSQYPSQLFEPDFEAWQYGPVDNTIYAQMKDNDLPTDIRTSDALMDSSTLESSAQKENVNIFLSNLISQIDNMDDFALVNRTHQDSSWKDTYVSGGTHVKMSADKIKNEYKVKLEKAI